MKKKGLKNSGQNLAYSKLSSLICINTSWEHKKLATAIATTHVSLIGIKQIAEENVCHEEVHYEF